ncbi:GAF domain-containing protein [Caballeronia sp. LZ008]|uniref:GAF domain-containing protein n=1 Tax=Caballeronia sp. LZ008 TaxID=3038560 RepID=UPI00285BED36|nr:GAF domain-containing protein [Caballeronia sp. LZ008]MDR5798077.1 GAF domain-containing protein [Caballeronia sp. LZ008]
MPCDQLLALMLSITASHAARQQPQTTFEALDTAMSEMVGRKLLTVLTVNRSRDTVERAYSNQSGTYAAGGTKGIESAPRLKQVLATGEAFIARNRHEIQTNYPDARAIFETGCSSILNVPVIWSGTVVATVNLLHDEEHYQDEHIPIVQGLAQAAMPAFLECYLALRAA